MDIYIRPQVRDDLRAVFDYTELIKIPGVMYKTSETKGKKSNEYEHDKKAPYAKGNKGAAPSVGKDSGNQEKA